jgi:hypothetical protein
LDLLATITLEVAPSCAHAPFQAFLPFINCFFEVRDLGGCSAPPAILPRSPQLCQNGDHSVLSLIGEAEKNTVCEDDSHVAFGKKFHGKKGSVRRCVVVM